MQLLKSYSVTPYQLKNAFDKLFEDLMEDKTREMEPAEVRAKTERKHQIHSCCF